MAAPDYHHSQRTKWTREEIEPLLPARARMVLEGTLTKVLVVDPKWGPCVMFHVDERYGLRHPTLLAPLGSFGGDMELFDLLPQVPTDS